jgi:IMP dehydrogenase
MKPQNMKTAIGFDDIDLLPNFSEVESRKDIDTSSHIAKVIWQKEDQTALTYPIILSPMDTVSSVESCIAMNEIGAAGILHRFQSWEDRLAQAKEVKEKSGKSYFAIGLDDFDRLNQLQDIVDLFFLDVAHGTTKQVFDFIRDYNSTYDWMQIPIITGNTLTMSSVGKHFDLGSDGVRHGIGGGSVCLTTEMTGIGCPFLTSNYYAWKAQNEWKHRTGNVFTPTILQDGGIRKPADLVKAIASGCNAVVVGGLFGGCRETPGDVQSFSENGDNPYKVYRGMASAGVQEDYELYESIEDKFVEGDEYIVPYTDKSVKDVVYELNNGLRSAMSYLGFNTFKQLKGSLWTDDVMAVRVTPNASYEASAHRKSW